MRRGALNFANPVFDLTTIGSRIERFSYERVSNQQVGSREREPQGEITAP